MSVQKFLDKIKNGRYGADITDAIIGGIKKCYDDASVNHDNANMEVKMARGTHNTLNERLNKSDEIQAQTNAQLSDIKEHCTGGNGMQEHSHVNKSTVDKLTENDGDLYFNGKKIGSEIEDNSVTKNKLSSDIEFKAEKFNLPNQINFFNKEDVVEGGYYEFATGEWVSNAHFCSTNDISVKKGDTYTFSWSGHVTFWSYDGTYVSGNNLSANQQITITNENINFLRMSIFLQNVNIDTAMLVKGSKIPSEYVSYKKIEIPRSEYVYEIKPKDIKEDMIPHDISPFKIKGIVEGSKTENLFDKASILEGGYYNYSNGKWVADARYVSSPFIMVESGETYTRSLIGQICYWDSNKEYVLGTVDDQKTFVVPKNNNIKYITYSVTLSTVDTTMFVKGDKMPEEYIDYQFAYVFSSDYKINTTSSALTTESTTKKYYSSTVLKANPPYPLNIETYTGGNNQPTHPKVLYFEDGWNGYKYWMAYTPYPNNNSAEENPCITYSNDGYNWSEEGIENPISTTPSGGYNSDTHLVLVNDTMECWWREVVNNVETIVRKKSVDGFNWGDREVLFVSETSNAMSYLSPVVMYDGEKYQIWVLEKQTGANPRCFLKYYESQTGYNWVFVREINITFEDNVYRAWHFDVIKTDKGYEFVGSYQYLSQFNVKNYIIYANSQDNITYTNFKKVLASGYEGNFDGIELYRPCLVRKSNSVMLYYGANGYQNNPKHWGIGLVESPSINTLAKLLEFELED